MISVCWTLEHFYSILTIVWLSYPTLPFFFFFFWSNPYFFFFFHPPFHRHREVAMDPDSRINSSAVELAEPLAFLFFKLFHVPKKTVFPSVMPRSVLYREEPLEALPSWLYSPGRQSRILPPSLSQHSGID